MNYDSNPRTRKKLIATQFPEYADLTGIDLTTQHKELKDSLYHLTTMNALMDDIRENIRLKSKLASDTEILVLDNCSGIEDLQDHLKNGVTQIKDQAVINKLVIILSILINVHYHSLVVHIDKIHTNSVIHMIFKDPYGRTNAIEEKYKGVEEKVRSFCTEVLKSETIAEIKYKSDLFDIQGDGYDNSNCGPLTVFCLNKYAEFALLDLVLDARFYLDEVRDEIIKLLLEAGVTDYHKSQYATQIIENIKTQIPTVQETDEHLTVLAEEIALIQPKHSKYIL